MIIPALVATVILDSVGSRINPQFYTAYACKSDFPLIRFAASLFCANEFWFYAIRPFSNGPFWSISYEASYYVLFGVWFFGRTRRKWIAIALIALVVGPKILILFPVWILGVLTYRQTRRDTISPRLGAAIFCFSLCGYCLYRLLQGPAFFTGKTEAILGEHAMQRLDWSGQQQAAIAGRHSDD